MSFCSVIRGAFRRVNLIYGKGGVGKTTFALLSALCLSRSGRRVLVVSMDPAKHLPGYAGCDCVNRRVCISGDGLCLEQYDVEEDARRLGEEYATLLRRISARLTVFNLDDLIEVVMDAPGLEEEAYLRRLMRVYEEAESYDHVVVDMPPTGVALRIIRLPRLYTVWLDALIGVRERLAEARAMLARVAGGEYTDPVLDKLRELRRRYHGVYEEVRSPSTTLHIGVATPEPLPVQEVEEVAKALSQMGAGLGLAVLNRVLPEGLAEELRVAEQQRLARSRLEGVAERLVEVPYLGRPTRSLKDVEELLGMLG